MSDKYLMKAIEGYDKLLKFILLDKESATMALQLPAVPVDDENIMIPNPAFEFINVLAQMFILGGYIRESIKKPHKGLYAGNLSFPEELPREPESEETDPAQKPSYARKKKITNDLISEVEHRIDSKTLKKAISYKPRTSQEGEYFVAILPQNLYIVLLLAATAQMTVIEIGLPPYFDV